MNGILIVEDESIVADDLEEFLVYKGYTVVDKIYNAEEALERAIQDDVGLIIMDINLKDTPGDMSGITIAREIRRYHQTPVVFLTAAEQIKVMENAASVANSYFLTKPFRELELLSRVKKTFASSTVRLDDEFNYDPQHNTLTRAGDNPIPLNPQQSKLLELFLTNKNKVLSHTTIDYTIWPDKSVTTATRTALISKLKKKLNGRFIHSLSKQGYVFIIED